MRMRRLTGLLFFLFLSLQEARAQAQPDREHRVKAVFLFNFAQFVEWPEAAFPNPQSPLVVGILGDDPFDAYLDEVVKGEKVNTRPIQVERYHRIEDIKVCHILFISASEIPRIDRVLAALKGRSILTVGESEGFFQHGGMVSFVTEHGKIRLKINLEAVQAEELTVSSKLLRLADVAGPGREERR